MTRIKGSSMLTTIFCSVAVNCCDEDVHSQKENDYEPLVIDI